MAEISFSERLLIFLVFLTSSSSKLRSRDAFHAFTWSTGRLARLGPGMARSAAALVALTEMAIVVLVTLPFTATALAAFILSAVSLTAFTAFMLRAVMTTLKVPCRCFGSTTSPVGWPDIARNAVLLGIALSGCTTATFVYSRTNLGPLALSAFATMFLAWLIVHLGDVLWLIPGQTSWGSARDASDPTQ